MNQDLENRIREFVKHSEGWMEPTRAVEMAQLILDVKPETVVEIGVFGGRSFISQAMALKELGRGVIYGIDAWKPEAAFEGENEDNKKWWANNVNLHDIHRLCVEAVWKHNLDEHAVIIRSPSQFCHKLFPEIDVLFIDGNHSETASCRDVEMYATSVNERGYLWFDDCDWPTTQKAQQMLLEFGFKVIADRHSYKLFQSL